MLYFYQNEFSVGSIRSISESYCKDDVLTESFITDFCNTYTNTLLDIGVANLKLVDNVKTCAEDISEIIKNEGLNGNSQKKIISTFESFVQSLGDVYIDSKVITSKNPSIAEMETKKVLASLKLFLNVYTINTIMGFIFSILLGLRIGRSLTVIIVGPIVEEMSKSIAIKGGFVKEYTVIFNVLEARSYIKRGAPIFGFRKMFVRMKCALLHVTTTVLQWLTLNGKLLEKCGVIQKIQKQ